MSSNRHLFPGLPPLDGHGGGEGGDAQNNTRASRTFQPGPPLPQEPPREPQEQRERPQGLTQGGDPFAVSTQTGIPGVGGYAAYGGGYDADETSGGGGPQRPWPPVAGGASSSPTPPSATASQWPSAGDEPRMERRERSSPYLGLTSQHRAIQPSDLAGASAPSDYTPGGGRTAPIPAVNLGAKARPDGRQDTQSWAAISTIMERAPTHTSEMHTFAALDVLVSGDIVAACAIEYEQVNRELDELRLLVKQGAKELEKLQQRKVLTAARVRELEERLELHSRAELREAYLAAAEAEMRAFMIAEQREQMSAKVAVYERYGLFLARTIDLLSGSQGGQAAEQAAGSAGAPYLRETAAPVSFERQRGGETLTPQAFHGVNAAEAGGYAEAQRTYGADLAMLTRVMQAQENVRLRVAQRLHDGPTQSLANVMLTAEICEKLVQSDPRRALTELANLKQLVSATLQETRKFIFELRPMTLDDLGLAATLRRYASDVAAKYRVQVPLVMPQSERTLPRELETPVFRAAQEAIMNAVEHGRATVVQVTLAIPADGLLLVVEDNGAGFDVEQALAQARAGKTMGLVSMQERAEMLGGWLRIESVPGRGSRIELTIPF